MQVVQSENGIALFLIVATVWNVHWMTWESFVSRADVFPRSVIKSELGDSILRWLWSVGVFCTYALQLAAAAVYSPLYENLHETRRCAVRREFVALLTHLVEDELTTWVICSENVMR
jgi:hypothetical protein